MRGAPAAILAALARLDKQYAQLRTALATIERECAVGLPRLQPTISQVKRLVGDIADDRAAATQRESDLLDTMASIVQARAEPHVATKAALSRLAHSSY